MAANGWFEQPNYTESVVPFRQQPDFIIQLPDSEFQVMQPWVDDCGEEWSFGDKGVVVQISADSTGWYVTLEHEERGLATHWALLDIPSFLNRTRPLGRCV